MTARIRGLFADRESSGREAAYRAFVELMTLTEAPVDWAYELWDRTVGDLAHKDGHKRAFAAQLLARLALSDPEGRMLRDFPRLAAAMKDEKTVTARHALQSIWRVGLAGPRQKALVVDALADRFRECAAEKNGSLVRTDVVAALAQLAGQTKDPAIEALADALIDSEPDEKARRKQRACWRRAASPP